VAETIPITKATVPEGVDVTHVARFWKPDGSVFASTDFTTPGTYDVEVYDELGTQILNETGTAVNASDPVFDAPLPTDGYWGGKDETGYNFRHTLTQAELTAAGLGGPFIGGKTYRVVYTLHSDSDGDAILIYEHPVESVYPS
jgi:hypothetical protein